MSGKKRISVRNMSICVIEIKHIYAELAIECVYFCLIFMTFHKAEVIQQEVKLSSENIISCLVLS